MSYLLEEVKKQKHIQKSCFKGVFSLDITEFEGLTKTLRQKNVPKEDLYALVVFPKCT